MSNSLRVCWVLTIGTVACVPVVFTTATFDVFGITQVTLLWLGTLAACGALLVHWGRGAALVRPAGWKPVVVFVSSMVVATVASRAPIVSLFGSYSRYDGLLTLLAVAALAALVQQCLAHRPARITTLMLAIAGSSTVGAGYLLIQELGWDWHQWAPTSHPPGLARQLEFLRRARRARRGSRCSRWY